MEIRNLEQKYETQIYQIIKSNLPKLPNRLFNIQQSSEEEDCQQSFDFKFTTNIQISCRIRDIKFFKYKDITIRSKSKKNKKTEIHKLQEGYGQIYFFGWEEDNIIKKWLLIDIDRIRHLLIHNGIFKYNYDGTAFRAYSFIWLKEQGAVIAHS